MANHSLIMGTVSGIARRDFLEMESELKTTFDSVFWKDGDIVIRSERLHEQVKELFQKMADRIQEGKFGSLLYIGNGRVGCIYFGHGKFAAKEYTEPIPPDWWGMKEPGTD